MFWVSCSRGARLCGAGYPYPAAVLLRKICLISSSGVPSGTPAPAPVLLRRDGRDRDLGIHRKRGQLGKGQIRQHGRIGSAFHGRVRPGIGQQNFDIVAPPAAPLVPGYLGEFNDLPVGRNVQQLLAAARPAGCRMSWYCSLSSSSRTGTEPYRQRFGWLTKIAGILGRRRSVLIFQLLQPPAHGSPAGAEFRHRWFSDGSRSPGGTAPVKISRVRRDAWTTA